MKIKVITLASAFLIAVASFVVVFASTPKLNENKSSAVTTTQNSNGYYLREFNSKIGVFTAGSNKPQQVLDVNISSLPFDAQKLIETGIYCRNKTELLQRIEDYTS